MLYACALKSIGRLLIQMQVTNQFVAILQLQWGQLVWWFIFLLCKIETLDLFTAWIIMPVACAMSFGFRFWFFLLALNTERGLCNLFYFDTIRWMQKQKNWFINQMKSTLKGLPETVLLFVCCKTDQKKTIAVAVNTILNFGFLWHSPYHYSSSTKWGRIFRSFFLLAFSTLSV